MLSYGKIYRNITQMMGELLMYIQDEIESMREKLYVAINNSDILQEEVLKISQDLDILILKYYTLPIF